MTTHEAGQDARVETVAIALWRSDTEDEFPDAEIERLWPKVVSHFPNDAAAYRRSAIAALAAMHPADETLRAKVETLAAKWEDEAKRHDDAEPIDSDGLTRMILAARFLRMNASDLRAVLGGYL